MFFYLFICTVNPIKHVDFKPKGTYVEDRLANEKEDLSIL